jgi:hypothetical protein
MKRIARAALPWILLAAAAPAVRAQQAAAPPRAALSTRATVEVVLNGRMIGGTWTPGATALAGPAKIVIDYGQPHARGRQVIGGPAVPWDTVWRTGANLATHLTTDVDLTIGTVFVPAGVYTLFTRPSVAGWELVVNRQVRQWGTVYDQRQDLARIPMRVRQVAEPLESLSVWLVPTQLPSGSTEPQRGVLTIAWGSTSAQVDWRVGR